MRISERVGQGVDKKSSRANSCFGWKIGVSGEYHGTGCSPFGKGIEKVPKHAVNDVAFMKTLTSPLRVCRIAAVAAVAVCFSSYAQTNFARPYAKPPETVTAPAAVSPTFAPTHSPGSVMKLPIESRLSPWSSEIVKLSNAGIDESVILSFVDNAGTFNLGADEIIYLHNAGVRNEVISAMLEHDYEIVSGIRPVTTTTLPPVQEALRQLLAALNDTSKAATGSSPNSAPATNAVPEGSPSPVLPESAPKLDWSGFPGFDNTLADDSDAASARSVAGTHAAPTAGAGAFPVREPYPVEIFDPILLVKAAWRTPNLLIIEAPQ